RRPPRRHQLFPQQLRGVFLDHDAGLEVETGREAEVLVGGTGETVDATVLTTAVRIDAGLESDVGTVVVGDDGPHRIAEKNRLRRRLFVGRNVVIGNVSEFLEAVLRIPARAATFDHAATLITAVPVSSPERRAVSASLARSSG